MDKAEMLDYVKAVAQALALPLDEARAQAVADHLSRSAALARLLQEVDMPPEDELAEIYRPAPFPPEGGA